VKKLLGEKPWILIVAAMALFMISCVVFLYIAQKHMPADVPLKAPRTVVP
jgi:hypothetical protein